MLKAFESFLSELDATLRPCFAKAGASIQCGQGCSRCCYGTFGISLLEGHYLREGLRQLPPKIQERVRRKCRELVEIVRRLHPELLEPFAYPEDPTLLEALFAQVDDIDSLALPCPLLDPTGRCLAYQHRPTACRFEGLPQIDTSGTVVVPEVCERNFIGEDPASRKDLAFPYYALDRKLSDLELEYMRTVRGEETLRYTFIGLALLLE